jgi:hypothetical protein
VEVLQIASRDTSTDFRLILSTKCDTVEVVEIVEVPSFILRGSLFYDQILQLKKASIV